MGISDCAGIVSETFPKIEAGELWNLVCNDTLDCQTFFSHVISPSPVALQRSSAADDTRVDHTTT